jgi:hypothetical protein
VNEADFCNYESMRARAVRCANPGFAASGWK